MSGGDHDRAGGGFRQRLDAVLRRRNPADLRAFLVAEGQWEPEARTGEEAAMWMMIAASPVLIDLHAEAERWLMAHGHEHEARAILGRPAARAGTTRKARPKPGGARAPRGSSAQRSGRAPGAPSHRDHSGGRGKGTPKS